MMALYQILKVGPGHQVCSLELDFSSFFVFTIFHPKGWKAFKKLSLYEFQQFDLLAGMYAESLINLWWTDTNWRVRFE